MFIYKLINFNIFNILYNLEIINISKSYHDQDAKRTVRNACSERRGIFSSFMDPRSIRILFLFPAKRIRCIT